MSALTSALTTKQHTRREERHKKTAQLQKTKKAIKERKSLEFKWASHDKIVSNTDDKKKTLSACVQSQTLSLMPSIFSEGREDTTLVKFEYLNYLTSFKIYRNPNLTQIMNNLVYIVKQNNTEINVIDNLVPIVSLNEIIHARTNYLVIYKSLFDIRSNKTTDRKVDYRINFYSLSRKQSKNWVYKLGWYDTENKFGLFDIVNNFISIDHTLSTVDNSYEIRFAIDESIIPTLIIDMYNIANEYCFTIDNVINIRVRPICEKQKMVPQTLLGRYVQDILNIYDTSKGITNEISAIIEDYSIIGKLNSVTRPLPPKFRFKIEENLNSREK